MSTLEADGGFLDFRKFPSVSIVLGLVLALGLAVMGTLLGAVVHERPAVAGCAASPCADYRDYGWPWAWASSNPGRVVQDPSNSEGYRFNQDGQSPGVFLFTTFAWFVLTLLLGAVLVVVGWGLRRPRLGMGPHLAPAYLIPAALSFALVAIVITNVLLVVQGHDRIFPEPCGGQECPAPYVP